MVRRLWLSAALLVACGGNGTGNNGDPHTGEHTPHTGATPSDLDHIETSTSPGKRSEILPGTHEGSNSILMFGGNDGPVVAQFPSPNFLNDTWVFEPGVGWFEIESDERPKKRGRYTMDVDEQGNRALLFGGRFRKSGETGDYTLFDDLWQFDYLTRQWSEIDSGGAGAPPARYYPASAYDDDTGKLYIWGGLQNEDPLNFRTSDDMWVWDGSEWEELSPTGDAPSPRGFFGNTYDPVRKRIVVFGGQVGNLASLAYQDMFALDIETQEWTRLHDGNNGPTPSTRMHAHLTYDVVRDRYLLWGGHTDNGDLNDLWEFPADGDRWKKVYVADKIVGDRFGCLGNSTEVPADYVDMDLDAPERRHRGMFALMYDNLWLFGGIHAECSDHLDDTWRYDIEGDTYHELIEATAGESCLRANEDCECLCI